MRRIVAAWRARAAHPRSLTHDPLAAASEQRWARRERYAESTAQIHAATVAFKSSGEVAADGDAAADSSHPPCESRPAIAAGSPGEPHRPDCIDAALARTRLFTRPQGDPQ